MDEFNLLVSSAPWAPGRARREIVARLRALGEPAPQVVPAAARGVSAAKTSLDPRRVVEELRALCVKSPRAFRFTSKWVPVDLWVRTDLESIKQGVMRLRQNIQPGETWRLTLKRHAQAGRSTRDLIAELASLIDAKVDLSHPDKVLLVEIFEDWVALALLRPTEMFSVVKTRRPEAEPPQAPSDRSANEGER
jgi:tRNA(Ser,Leu) C12 N-acetylase TAN1